MRLSNLWPVMGLLLLSTSLHAGDNVAMYQDKPRSYVGGSLIVPTVDFASGGNSATLTGAVVRLGGMASDYWGMEVRLGGGLLDDSGRDYYASGYFDSEFSLNYLGAAYLTGRMPFMEIPRAGTFYGQAWLGASTERLRGRVELCDPGCTSNTEYDDQQSLSWGVGLGLQPLENWSASLDYFSYTSGDSYDITSVEAGIMYHF